MTGKNRMKTQIAGALVFFCLFIGCELVAEEWSVVTHVLDGDTVILKDGRRIRYAGINAPEIDHGDEKAEPYGHAAKKQNEKLVLSRRVRLEFGKEKTDRHGRQVAHIFLAGGGHVNAILVEKGLAWCVAHEADNYAPVLPALQRSAMSKKKGVWRLSQMKREHRYAGNRRSLRFHEVSCGFGKKIAKANRIRFASKWEAFYAGHSPCAKCMPRLDRE